MPNIIIPQQYLRNLSKKDQITELNNEVRCKVGISKIDGIGVFALRNIQKGERCYMTPNIIPRFYNIPYSSLNQLLPEIKELILQRWASVVNGSVFQSPNDDAGLLFFCNHSPEPNYDCVSDTALRDIEEGEEIFEDYTMMKNWRLAYPNLESWQNALIYNVQKKRDNLSVARGVLRLILNWFKN